MSSIKKTFFGLVAENKPLETKNILIWPIEKTPWLQGAIKSNPQTVEVEGKNSGGQSVKVKANTDTVIEAEWRPVDSSWDTAPDVQRGEVVEVFQFADQNKYYWRERGDMAALRRGETKRLMVSASLTNTGKGVSTDTHYMLEISGHTGAINLTTSSANGEVARYHLTIDGKGGAVSLGDDVGNEVYLGTNDKIVRLRNAAGCMVQLQDKDITLNAEEDLGIVCRDNIYIDCKNLYIKSSESINATSRDIFLNGIIHLNGPIVQDEGTSEDFSAALKGPVNVEKDLIANRVSVSGHDHDGVERGEGTTDKPNKTE